MGNPFSCCHPGRKEEDRGGGSNPRARLLQDNSTQTAGFAEEETNGSTRHEKSNSSAVGSSAHILRQKQPAEATRGEVHSSSSSSSNIDSNGSCRAGIPVASGSAQHQASTKSGVDGTGETPANAAGGATNRGAGGVAPRGFPAGLSTVVANGSGAGAHRHPAPAAVYRSAGAAIPRAHPSDQQSRPQQQAQMVAGGTAHARAGAGDVHLVGGRGGVHQQQQQHHHQQYNAGAAARGVGGRFGVAGGTFGGGRTGGVFAGKTVARAVPAAAGTVLAKYEMKEVLGVGSTSKCYRCVNRKSKKQFACKVIDKRAMDPKLKPLLDQFHVEIQVLQLLRHPNIIHMEDVFESESKIHMVMEIMQGGELFDYVVEKGTLSESEASGMVRKVTSALAYMHSLNIIHRDLKPENLLLTSKGASPEVKIIDFGLAKVLGAGDDSAQSFLGTRGYLAPEMLQRESYSKEVDVWALGVISFVLLCGCLPFDDDSAKLNRAGAFQKFVLRFPRWAQTLSPGAKDLLSKLLTVTPRARLTAKQALEHPWVTGKAAAANNFLESPRTLRRLRVNSPKPPGWGGGGGGARGNGGPQQSAAAASAAAAEAHRRAEFEEQSDEYKEGGVGLAVGRSGSGGTGGRFRRKNSF
ncbi:unnamed protein product [Pylaiella littoralis]